LGLDSLLYRSIERGRNLGEGWDWKNESVIQEAFEYNSQKVADLVVWGAMQHAYSSGASTVPPPPAPERPDFFMNMGRGKCRTINDVSPRFRVYWDVTEGMLAEKCRNTPGCGGYTWEYGRTTGYIWLEAGLFGGGYKYGGRCMILGEKNQGVGHPTRPPGVYYESDGEGMCINPDRPNVVPNRKVLHSGSREEIEKQCTDDPECWAYVHAAERDGGGGRLYFTPDTIGGGETWLGVECMMKRFGTPPPPTPSPVEQYQNLGPGKCLNSSGGEPRFKYYQKGSDKFLAQE